MSNSASKKLTLVKKLINEFRYEEGLRLVKDIEQIDNLTAEEMLETQVYKGWLYVYSEQLDRISFSEQLKTVEDLYQKSLEMELTLFSLDAICLKAFISLSFEGPKEIIKNIEQYEIIFKAYPRTDTLVFKEKEAILYLFRGSKNWFLGKNNLALEYHSKSLAMFKQIDPQSHFINAILWAMALDYLNKGELKLALEYAEKALSLIPKGEDFGNKYMTKAVINRSMGEICYQRGDLNRALKHYKHSLELWNKVKGYWFMPRDHFNIILVFIAQKKIDQAQNYLQQFKVFNEMHELTTGALFFQLAYALILKSSPRMRDHTQAEKILKKIVEGDTPSISLITINALKNLCEIYFEEFQLTHHMDILDDIYPLIKHLQKIASQINSYPILATLKLLKAKLSLLEVNMVEARILLTKAQKIAHDHGLQRLAEEISREHDHLLKELKLWESFKKEQASVAERLKLASIDGVMERLQGRGAIEVSEASVEEPILLLIMDESGVSYFNHSFVGDWDFEDLFSSFMSAFNTFSGEIFSRSIDRIKIGENTILINPIEPFLACYVIKGQSYPAQQKLTQFSERIKATIEIWEALKKAAKTSEMLEMDNPPSLGSTVTEIFIGF